MIFVRGDRLDTYLIDRSQGEALAIRVLCSEAAIGELRVEGIENSLPMGFDDRRNLLH